MSETTAKNTTGSTGGVESRGVHLDLLRRLGGRRDQKAHLTGGGRSGGGGGVLLEEVVGKRKGLLGGGGVEEVGDKGLFGGVRESHCCRRNEEEVVRFSAGEGSANGSFGWLLKRKEEKGCLRFYWVVALI